MKRLFVLMSCAVSLSAFASDEPVKSQPVRATSANPATAPGAVYRVTTPAPAAGHATVITVPAGSNVTVVSAPQSSPQTGMAQGERPSNERIPFRAGVSTVTIEKMAQALGCVGGQGAGLMTPQGPVEVYRMVCESGQVYMAKCELRQCHTISSTPPGGYGALAAGASGQMHQMLGRSEVPALVLAWRCGNCVPNADFAAALQRAYAAEAAHNGMTVSSGATTSVSVDQFDKHIFPLRNSLQMSALFGRQSVNVEESTTAFSGMSYLADVAAKKLFQTMRGKAY